MKSIKSNLLFNASYQVYAFLIGIIIRPYISRKLGVEGIGVYAYANSIANYFVIFALLGLANYGNRSIAAVRDDKDKLSATFLSIFGLQFITSIMSISLYIIYIVAFSEDKYVSTILLLYVISSLFDITWFFNGLEEFRFVAIRNICIKTGITLLIFIFVKNTSSLYAYCTIQATASLVSQVSLWTKIRKYVIWTKPTVGEIISHIKPNLILFIPVIAVSLYKIMDKIMIGLLSTKIEVGFYESAESLVSIPLMLISSLGVVMLPRMSNLYAKGDENAATQYIEISFNLAIFLSASMAFGIMGVSKEFVPIFFGEGYNKCILVLQVLLPSCIFLAIANVIRTQFLIPKKMDKVYIISVICGACINMIVNYLLIPQYGSVGASIGTFLAEGAVCLVQLFYIWNKIDVALFIKKGMPYVLSGFLMYVMLVNVRLGINIIAQLVIKVLIGVLIYISSVIIIEFIVKIIKPEYHINILDFISVKKK